MYNNAAPFKLSLILLEIRLYLYQFLIYIQARNHFSAFRVTTYHLKILVAYVSKEKQV